jgi:predicted TIM-barrel fold metal-dependent hydrolase
MDRRPSEMFAAQCVISSEPDDDLCAWVCTRVGSDHVMWASDFPHPDAAFPNAVDEFLERGLTADDLRAVLWHTPRRFYGIEHRTSVSAGASTG